METAASQKWRRGRGRVRERERERERWEELLVLTTHTPVRIPKPAHAGWRIKGGVVQKKQLSPSFAIFIKPVHICRPSDNQYISRILAHLQPSALVLLNFIFSFLSQFCKSLAGRQNTWVWAISLVQCFPTFFWVVTPFYSRQATCAPPPYLYKQAF